MRNSTEILENINAAKDAVEREKINKAKEEIEAKIEEMYANSYTCTEISNELYRQIISTKELGDILRQNGFSVAFGYDSISYIVVSKSNS